MSTPTWREYLAEATDHLAAVRALSEIGAPPPTPPVRPTDPMPEEYRDQVHHLALGYDQLALEIVTRMAAISQRRPLLQSKNPHQELLPAQFVDTPL
ncbi:MAG: hypothetical protein ACYC1I_09395 [Acidimicrobiales bacterium]